MKLYLIYLIFDDKNKQKDFYSFQYQYIDQQKILKQYHLNKQSHQFHFQNNIQNY